MTRFSSEPTVAKPKELIEPFRRLNVLIPPSYYEGPSHNSSRLWFRTVCRPVPGSMLQGPEPIGKMVEMQYQ
jgi:hypothetical protein